MAVALPLFAFGFGNIAMLGWLAAAAAPLLIHLWSRHRFREAPWAAMQFLLAAMRKNARRMQLQQWLLLAVRTLIILLAVFAVAEPYGDRLLAGNSAPRHKVLVIDDSFSMSYQVDDESLIAQAKRLAANVVRDSRSDDVFTIIRMSKPARVLAGPATIDHSAAAAQIDAINGSQTTADLAATLALVKKALVIEGRPTRLDYQQDVCFFTDFQAATWDPSEYGRKPANGDSSTADALKEIANQATVTVVNLGPTVAPNLAVTELNAPESVLMPGTEIEFHATLHQFGNQPRQQCGVSLLVDDQAVAEQTIDVPAGGDATVHFRHRFASPGSHAVCVRAAADDLSIDNTRWLVAPVRGELRVLCVAGREGAAKYVSDALNPDPSGDAKIRPVVIADGDFADAALADYDSVFLCNVAQLTANEVERLARFTSSGGGLVIFLGDRVIPEKYNTFSTGKPDQVTLIPAQIGEVVSKPQFGIDPLEYRHPIVAPFRGRERAGLLTTPVSRYYHLVPDPNRRDVEIAAALPDGNPFIVAAPLGRGRVVVVATDASTLSADTATGEPWTTWATWPSFLPLVRELLSNAIAGNRTERQHTVGSTIGGDKYSAAIANSLQVKRPDGDRASPATRVTADGIVWSYSETNLSGIYTVRGVGEDPPQQFAVNVDSAESDLAKADIKRLPPEIKMRTEPSSSRDSNAVDVLAKSAWNQNLLWGVLALMLAESYLAWLFGRGAP
jgi:hypothetical protein